MIPCRMTEAVVDCLEPVEIGHDDRQGQMPVPLRFAQTLEIPAEAHAVAQPCQRVVPVHFLYLADQILLVLPVDEAAQTD